MKQYAGLLAVLNTKSSFCLKTFALAIPSAEITLPPKIHVVSSPIFFKSLLILIMLFKIVNYPLHLLPTHTSVLLFLFFYSTYYFIKLYKNYLFIIFLLYCLILIQKQAPKDRDLYCIPSTQNARMVPGTE